MFAIKNGVHSKNGSYRDMQKNTNVNDGNSFFCILIKINSDRQNETCVDFRCSQQYIWYRNWFAYDLQLFCGDAQKNLHSFRSIAVRD